MSNSPIHSDAIAVMRSEMLDVLENNILPFWIDKMVDYEYVGDSSIKQLLGNRNYNIEPSLHLSVSLRSFRSEKLSNFIKAILDNEPQKASSIYETVTKPMLMSP